MYKCYKWIYLKICIKLKIIRLAYLKKYIFKGLIDIAELSLSNTIVCVWIEIGIF